MDCLALCSRQHSLLLAWQHHLVTRLSPLQVEHATGEVEFHSHQLAHLPC